MTLKFTGKNGGDPTEYWRAIKQAATVQISDALKAGRYLINEKIIKLTARGLDYSGTPFERYTDEYARRKGSTKVNLRVSGGMLGALKMSVNGVIYGKSARGTGKEQARSMSVGIYDDEENARKGAVHNEGLLRRTSRHGRKPGLHSGGVMRIPKRRWLDATSETVGRMEQVAGESMAKRIEDAL